MDSDIGARLKALRNMYGLSQREVAKRAGVTNSTISGSGYSAIFAHGGIGHEAGVHIAGTLIDGFGNDPIRNSVILIEGDKITEVGTTTTLEVPEGYEVISTEGMSVLPGLWDMHVHLMINGHSDYGYWDAEYLDRFASEIMPASAAPREGGAA